MVYIHISWLLFLSEVDLCDAVLPLIAVSLLTALWQSCQLALSRSQAHLQSLSSQLLEFMLCCGSTFALKTCKEGIWQHLEMKAEPQGK